MYKVRILTQDECPKCKSFINRLSQQNFEFETLTETPENSKDFDSWKIEEFPVVQILVDGKVASQMPPGTYSPQFIQKWADNRGIK